MYVIDEENNRIEVDVDIGSLPLVSGQKLMASNKVINHLLKFANYLSKETNRTEFIKFNKIVYIVELYESAEGDIDVTASEDTIISMFEDIELKEIISLLNILVTVKFPILDRFLLNFMDYTLKSMSIPEFKKYFQSCHVEDEVPEYII